MKLQSQEELLQRSCVFSLMDTDVCYEIQQGLQVKSAPSSSLRLVTTAGMNFPVSSWGFKITFTTKEKVTKKFLCFQKFEESKSIAYLWELGARSLVKNEGFSHWPSILM